MVIVSYLFRDTDSYWKINTYFNLRIFSRRALKHQRPLSRRLKLNWLSIIAVNLLHCNKLCTISSLKDWSLYLKHISISFRANRRYFKLKIHHNNHTFCNGRQLESHSNSSYYIKDIYFFISSKQRNKVSNSVKWAALARSRDAHDGEWILLQFSQIHLLPGVVWDGASFYPEGKRINVK